MEVFTDRAEPEAPATELAQQRFLVDAATVVRVRLSPAGGAAMRIAPASKDEAASLPRCPVELKGA